MTERSRRPHPAAVGRILAAGAATSATLGLMTAMMIAEPDVPASASTPDPAAETAVPGTEAAAETTTVPPPQVIVVMVPPGTPTDGNNISKTLPTGPPATTVPAPAPKPAPKAPATKPKAAPTTVKPKSASGAS
jgi:hypothetical protein